MRLTLAAALAALLALACSIRPPPAEYDYFVLSASEREPASEAPASDAPVLVVSRVTIPDYLQREAMAARIGEGRVAYSKRDRWAEPLEEGIARTLRDDLGRLLWPRVLVQPGRIGTPPAYSVSVDVLRFERIAPREVELHARFAIHADGALVHAGEARHVEPAPGGDAAAATAALGRALARLSREIAAAVP